MVIPLNAGQMKIFTVFYCEAGEELDLERGGEWEQLFRGGPGGPDHEPAPGSP